MVSYVGQPSRAVELAVLEPALVESALRVVVASVSGSVVRVEPAYVLVSPDGFLLFRAFALFEMGIRPDAVRIVGMAPSFLRSVLERAVEGVAVIVEIDAPPGDFVFFCFLVPMESPEIG